MSKHRFILLAGLFALVAILGSSAPAHAQSPIRAPAAELLAPMRFTNGRTARTPMFFKTSGSGSVGETLLGGGAVLIVLGLVVEIPGLVVVFSNPSGSEASRNGGIVAGVGALMFVGGIVMCVFGLVENIRRGISQRHGLQFEGLGFAPDPAGHGAIASIQWSF